MNPLESSRIIGPDSPHAPERLSDGSPSTPKENSPSFQAILGDLVREVNGLQQDADRSIEGLITGETVNLHDVTTRMAEAGVAFDLMMEVRNKLMDAYQQIMRMQA
jgi:flagellar hook-basal body complex protein FliE